MSNNLHWPQNSNTLAKIYSKVRANHPLVLQKHLWDYRNSGTLEKRAEEIILVLWEKLSK
jgi:hypothetical protein